MVFPLSSGAPFANQDLPEDILRDFNEAREILSVSPRGAAALLRLCVQKLCAHLGEKGRNINDDISSLVSKGLPQRIQQALDIVRVVGNNAVHPGQMDLRDNQSIASALFGLVNAIADTMITQPQSIQSMYDNLLPLNQRNAISDRDAP